MALTVDIEKRMGEFHLDVRFETGNGVLSLLGASGCGKSVTLKCIAGIERPDRGRIVLNGVTLFDSERHVDLPPQKRRVGYLFQQYALFPNMTVRQNIRCGVREREGADAAVDGIIRKMHLEGLEKLRPRQLSGGQQQRVALARILVNRPEVLLLDEPFSALDSHLRLQLEQEVREIIRDFGKPVLFVSHDREEVFRLTDRIAIMKDGLIETLDEKNAVFADPKTVNGAALTGCRNVSRARKTAETRLFAIDWGVELEFGRPVGEAQYVGIRGHDIQPGEGENSLCCRVAEVVENPFSATLLLRPLGEGAAGELVCRTSKKHGAQNAETLTIHMPERYLLALKE